MVREGAERKTEKRSVFMRYFNHSTSRFGVAAGIPEVAALANIPTNHALTAQPASIVIFHPKMNEKDWHKEM